MDKRLLCPDCGEFLVLSADLAYSVSRKINKDGHVSKTFKPKEVSDYDPPVYLECEKCGFTYDCEQASGDKPIPEFNDWIWEHQNEFGLKTNKNRNYYERD